MALEPLPPMDGDGLGDAELAIVEPLCAVFRRKLKAEGLKYTPERARVLDVIVRFDGPFAAEGLLERLHGEPAVGAGAAPVSKATVYRTLKLMEEAGLLQRVPLGEGEAHYQLVYGPRPHDLLVRLDTGRVETVVAPELVALRERLCRERGLEARGHRFVVYAVGGG